MKQSATFLSIVCILVLAMGCSTQVQEKQFLRTNGQDIVDGNGNTIMLRGVGLGNWLLPEGYMWKFGKEGDRPRKIEKIVSDLIGAEKAAEFWQQFRKYYITEADIARIAELGFNSVRPALNARLFLSEGDNAQFIEESFVLIDSLVSWCEKHNLYVIIDMHGAPGGQTGENIDDSPADEPELFMDVRNQDRLVDLWVKIAKRYSDNPTVAAYDLLNEPLPHNTGAAEKYAHLVEPLYRRITAAIRAVDNNHMITLEGVNWSNDWSIFGKPFDDNVFYQFHYYCWNRPDNLNDISHYINMRDTLNTPVWVGETGEKGNAIYWATTQYFEANNIGWSFWPWKKMDTRNTPYSINRPADWDQIAAYSRSGEDAAEKPAADVAQRAFDELIENIKLQNCVYFPDVVNSILRRAPVKIEAENYGNEGYGVSYSVTDTLQRAAVYRVNEPVQIALIEHREDYHLSQQGVVLKEDEWVRYSFGNTGLPSANIVVKAKSTGENATIEVSLNGESESLNFGSEWQEIPLSIAKLAAGENALKLAITSGEIWVDWISVGE